MLAGSRRRGGAGGRLRLSAVRHRGMVWLAGSRGILGTRVLHARHRVVTHPHTGRCGHPAANDHSLRANAQVYGEAARRPCAVGWLERAGKEIQRRAEADADRTAADRAHLADVAGHDRVDVVLLLVRRTGDDQILGALADVLVPREDRVPAADFEIALDDRAVLRPSLVGIRAPHGERGPLATPPAAPGVERRGAVPVR